MWVIDDGLKPDDQVIVEGVGKGEGRNARRSQARKDSGGGTLSHVEILHQASDRRHRHLDPDGDRWRDHDHQPSCRAVSGYCSSRNTRLRHVPGRRCRDHGESRSHADRAADQRRGQHGLHVLAELDQQLEYSSDGRFRSQNRPQHGPHPYPVAPATGQWPASSRGQPDRHRREEIPDLADDADRPCTHRRALTTRNSWPTTPTSI